MVAMLGSACAARHPDADPIRREVESRAALPVRWDQGTDPDEQVRGRIRELLAGELSVEAATEVALLNNRSLQAMYERMGIAQADLVEAGLLRNPVLAGGVRYANGRGTPLPEYSVTQELLSVLVLPLRKKLAREQWEQQKLLVADAVLELAADVKAAWFEAQGAEHVARMRQAVADASAAGAEIARRQHEAGNISDLQLALEEDLHEQAKLDRAEAEAHIVSTRERLHRLLGVWGADTGWKLSAELPALPAAEPPLDHLESIAIARRLDLAADRQEVAILTRASTLTNRWRFFPALEIGVESESEEAGVSLYGPSIAFELPLFDRGQARRARLQSQHRQSENVLAAHAVEVRSEVREARDRMLRLRRQAEYYRDTLIPLRERIVLLSQQRYNAMLLGVYDLLRAKQSEVDTYRAYLETLRDYWIARADLERAAGGSLMSPEGDKP